jgi:glycine hydroxymethyltransferase
MILAKEKFGPAIDKAVFPGAQGGPLVHIIAAKAVCFKEASTPEFHTYQQQILNNARALAKAIQSDGYRVVSGGTDSHMFLVDVFVRGIKGKEAEKALDQAHITVNKNAIPFDSNPPLNPSGIRLGTPAVTTRGMGESEMAEIAHLLTHVLNNIQSAEAISEARRGVEELTRRFPLYQWKRQPSVVAG